MCLISWMNFFIVLSQTFGNVSFLLFQSLLVIHNMLCRLNMVPDNGPLQTQLHWAKEMCRRDLPLTCWDGVTLLGSQKELPLHLYMPRIIILDFAMSSDFKQSSKETTVFPFPTSLSWFASLSELYKNGKQSTHSHFFTQKATGLCTCGYWEILKFESVHSSLFPKFNLIIPKIMLVPNYSRIITAPLVPGHKS